MAAASLAPVQAADWRQDCWRWQRCARMHRLLGAVAITACDLLTQSARTDETWLAQVCCAGSAMPGQAACCGGLLNICQQQRRSTFLQTGGSIVCAWLVTLESMLVSLQGGSSI